jgi:RND family efflux transporter MFP subunit
MYTKILASSMLTASAVVLMACGSPEQAEEELIRPVRYTRVSAQGVARIRKFSGVAQSSTEPNLSFRLPGTVERVLVDVGDQVRRGQILAKLDPADYDLQAREAKAARAQARALEIQAKSNYERVQGMYENQSASKSDLDAARAAYESAHEQDNIMKRRRELADRQLRYTRLRAPADGAIADVRIDENENVNSGEVVMVLTSAADIEVNVSIPELLISQIQDGDTVEVTFDAIRGKTFAGTISEVGVASIGFATTYPVMVQLKETDTPVLPGMAAEVAFSFRSEYAVGRILVPSFAVGEDRSGRFVYLIDSVESGRGMARRMDVEVGELHGENLEILSGISEGDYLVTAGVTKLHDGQRVSVGAPGER